jgi:tRNA 2-thiouridine synthesizing protein C
MTSPARKNFLLVCRKPPYGDSLAKEAIDIALATAVFEQDLTIVFMGDGVWQLHDNQNSQSINSKNQQKLLSALPLYDINNIVVDTEALQERNINITELFLEAKSLSNSQLSSLFEDADVILNF